MGDICEDLSVCCSTSDTGQLEEDANRANQRILHLTMSWDDRVKGTSFHK